MSKERLACSLLFSQLLPMRNTVRRNVFHQPWKLKSASRRQFLTLGSEIISSSPLAKAEKQSGHHISAQLEESAQCSKKAYAEAVSRAISCLLTVKCDETLNRYCSFLYRNLSSRALMRDGIRRDIVSILPWVPCPPPPRFPSIPSLPPSPSATPNPPSELTNREDFPAFR